MPRPGYLTSIEDVGVWFKAPGNSEFNKFAIHQNDEKGAVIYMYAAPDHEIAWSDCERQLSLYHAGCYFIRFLAGSGRQSGMGLDLSPLPPQQTGAMVPHLGGVNLGLGHKEYEELLKHRWEKQHKESNSIMGVVTSAFKNDPNAASEIVHLGRDFLQVIAGFAGVTIPQRNDLDHTPRSGVAIAGAGGDNLSTVKSHHLHITESCEKIIDCFCYTIVNNGDNDLKVNNAPVPSYVEYPPINGKRYRSKISFSAKNVDVTLITVE